MARLFGTNGIRWVHGTWSREKLVRLGGAFASVFDEFLVVFDTRAGNREVLGGLLEGLLGAGSEVYLGGRSTTPALQHACRELGIAGLSVTASHNPPHYVGVKLIDKDGTEASRKLEEAVEEAFEEVGGSFAGKGRIGEFDVIDLYLAGTARDLGLDLRVVVDAANGAASSVLGRGLSLSGLSVTGLYSSPSGHPSRGLDPSNDELYDIRRLVVGLSAYAGFATDGDGDRLIGVDDRGSIVRGDRMISLLAMSLLKPGDKIVVSSVSSSLIDLVAEDVGAKVIRTRVGAPAVIETLKREGAKLGGEDNGGIIFAERPWRDSLYAALRILESLNGKKLSDALSDLPQIYTSEGKIRVSDKEKAWSKLENAMSGRRLVDVIEFEIDGNRCLVRPSGTEKVLRVYAEGKTETEARLTLRKAVDRIKELLGNQHNLKQE